MQIRKKEVKMPLFRDMIYMQKILSSLPKLTRINKPDQQGYSIPNQYTKLTVVTMNNPEMKLKSNSIHNSIKKNKILGNKLNIRSIRPMN